MNWWLKCTWLTQHSPCFHLTNPCCVSDSEWLSRWYDVFVSILFIYYHNTFNDNCGPSSAKYINVLCIFVIFSFEDDEAHDCYNLESMRTEHWTAHIIFSRIACYSVLSKYIFVQPAGLDQLNWQPSTASPLPPKNKSAMLTNWRVHVNVSEYCIYFNRSLHVLSISRAWYAKDAL